MKGSFVMLLCVLCSTLQAQSVSVSYSNSFKLRDHTMTEKEGSTFWYDKNFYCTEEAAVGGMHLLYTVTLAKLKYKINLYKYDEQMNEVGQVTLGAEEHFGPFAPFTAVYAGKIWVFYYQMGDKPGVDLMYAVVNPETLVAEPGKKLGMIDESNAWGFKSLEALEKNRLRVAFTPDSTRMMVAQFGNTPDVMTFLFDKDGPVGKPRISHFELGEPKYFTIDQAFVDNAGDRLFTYKYWIDKHWQQGILVQNAKSRDKWLDIEPMKDGSEAGVVFIHPSSVSDKIYVFGPTGLDGIDQGVFLATLDISKLRLTPPELYSYPPEVLIKLEKMDYTDKKHKNFGMKRAYYDLHEMADGAVVLTGYPVDVVEHTSMKMTGMNAGTTTEHIHHYAGPLLNIFISNGKCAVGIIPRSQEETVASSFIAIPYQDRMVIVYNDNEKSIGSDDPKINGKKYEITDLVLAYAVVGEDGTVLERKKLADREGKLSFFTGYMQSLDQNNFLIPMCEYKYNMIRYYMQMQRWATVKIE